MQVRTPRTLSGNPTATLFTYTINAGNCLYFAMFVFGKLDCEGSVASGEHRIGGRGQVSHFFASYMPF